MKYAIVSDIHGNLRAWQAVWADRARHGVDGVICLGDIVGYGPYPAEVAAAIRHTVKYVVRGNHDAAVTGDFATDVFNDEARGVLEWTVSHLGARAKKYLANLPYIIEIDCDAYQVACVHGSMYQPEAFHYIFTEKHARRTWEACTADIVFVGHTHIARVDMLDAEGKYSSRLPQNFRIESGRRYIVNVGSVGMPRVDDPYAYYSTFDTRERRIEWHRVKYDIMAFRKDIRKRIGNEEARTLVDAIPRSHYHRQPGEGSG